MYEWRLPCYREALATERAATMADGEFGHLEHLHYGGESACREWVRLLDLKSEDFVLDLGCGVGGTERFLFREVGCRYVGLDVRPDFIEFARTRSGRAERFRVHDIREPWLDDATAVLAVLSLGRLEHVDDVLQNVFSSMTQPKFLFEIVAEQEQVSRCLDLLTAYAPDYDHLDCTKTWATWAFERARRFEERHDEFMGRYGGHLATDRKQFYDDVCEKFASGGWIGMRISSSTLPVLEWDVKKMTILEFEADENRNAKG